MNHNRSLTLGIALMLIILMAGCAPAKAESVCPTAAVCPTAQACPTAPSCPSASVKAPEVKSVWFSQLDAASEIKINFDPGDKCTLSSLSSHTKGLLYYHLQVNDQAHASYAIVIQTVDEGKTLADLQAYPKNAKSAPSWAHNIQEKYVEPGSNSYDAINISEGPIYISCLVEGENGPERIADFGPIEIIE